MMKRATRIALFVLFLSILSINFNLPINRVLADDSNGTGQLISTKNITYGAKLEKWGWNTGEGKVIINVIEADLKNPYIKIDSLIGSNGVTANKETIMNMAKESGAVAAINGDYYTLNAEGAPFGVTIQDSQMITSPGFIHAKNAFAIDNNRIPYIQRIDFSGKVESADGSSFPLFGINKTQYQAGYKYVANSHINRLHMYTNNWNLQHWVGDQLESYKVVVVEDGRAIKVLTNEPPKSIPSNGYVLLGNGEAADFLTEHISLGGKVEVDYSLSPDLTYQAAVDGSTLLVDHGERAFIEYEIKGDRARTAIGYSQDKRFLYLVSVEKSSNSAGMGLKELTDFLLSRGVWKAVNMDGGGSTTMVARGLGSYSLTDITKPEYGAERPVTNGLAIFSTAPKGEIIDFDMDLAKGVLLGESMAVKIKTAYDEYYNPVAPSEIDIQWTIPQGVTYDNGVFTFHQLGTFTLTASVGKVKKEYKVHVYGVNSIKNIKIEDDVVRLWKGEQYQPTVKLSFIDGNERIVENKLLKWSIDGLKAEITAEGKLTAVDQSQGLLLASYQGFTTSVPVDIGGMLDYRVIDLFQNSKDYLITGLTGKENASFEINVENGKSVGTLTYDFSHLNQMRIVYLQYGTMGKSVINRPAELSLDIKGDNSNHWLRTEIRDAKGKIYYTDLAKSIDWTGWKTVKTQLPTNIAYPITIKSIYVVHLEDGKDTTATKGQLSFSQFKVRDWRSFDKKENLKLQLSLNSKEVAIGTEKKLLDQAPIVLNGRTYVPVRHIAELMGGTVQWVGLEKKVEIINDYKVINYWLNNGYMNNNGNREDLDEVPFIKNGRTMLPLRSISEGLGLYIYYDKSTKNIYIQ